MEEGALGFREADSSERLHDIFDDGLSVGTKTDGSISSIVEYYLFPDLDKALETTPTKDITSNKLPWMLTWCYVL